MSSFEDNNKDTLIQAVTDEIKKDLNIISNEVESKIDAYNIDDTIETCNTDADTNGTVTKELDTKGISNIDPTSEKIILELNKEIDKKILHINQLKFQKFRNFNQYKDILPQLNTVVDEIKTAHENIYMKNAELKNLMYTVNNSMIKLEELHSKMSRNMRWASSKCNRGGKRQRKTRKRKTQRRRM